MNWKKEKNNNPKENIKKKLKDHEFLESIKRESLEKFPKKLKYFQESDVSCSIRTIRPAANISNKERIIQKTNQENPCSLPFPIIKEGDSTLSSDSVRLIYGNYKIKSKEETINMKQKIEDDKRLNNFIIKTESNDDEIELMYNLKDLYMKHNSLTGLSDKKFSIVIGIRISDLKTRKTKFSAVRFKKVLDFIDNFNEYDKKIVECKIIKLLKKRLSIQIPKGKETNAEYIFAHDLLELYREIDLYIVLKDFCAIIEFYLSSSFNQDSRISDNSIRKIRKKLLPYFNSDQILKLDVMINVYKENRRDLELKEFDINYKRELKFKIRYIFEYLPIPDDFNISDLVNLALEYFDSMINNKLTYQDMIPSAHSGYVAPALVYYVLLVNNIYYIDNKRISAHNIISKKIRDLKILGLTGRTSKNIPIHKLYEYLSDELKAKVGVLTYKDYSMDDFTSEFNQIRNDLDFSEKEYPKGRELNKISPKYKSFVRATYRFGKSFDNIVEKSGLEPFRKKYLKYNPFELNDYANKIIEIANELGYEEGVCPSAKDLERHYQPLTYSFRKNGYILKDLIPFGLYPSDFTLSQAVGGLVHYIFEYEIIKYLLDKLNLKSYYEIYPNIYSFEYHRIDNAILNNALFKNTIFSKQNIINLSESQLRKIILFLFDYTISSDLEFVIDKCNRNYHNSQRFLIIVSLFRIIYDIPNDVPHKSHVIQLDFNEFSQLLLLPDCLHEYLKEIILLAKNALYPEDININKSLEDLSVIASKARQEMLNHYRPLCNQEALEKDLLELFEDMSDVENFLKNNSL
ncbi:hypothetical protein LCGC14_0657540 [marine sediment metagenome]|uniref:Uncharacterized protein n=1 Tax=marine sediment metagenome TaxID=412755 RepID=A0A0F9QUL0_9ZZZZ|nr:MAG: hypothetical protein Lokiarch_45350 [Candidatus Lokiarchaeum sp. GC14_75]